jgi:hypothetical protein
MGGDNEAIKAKESETRRQVASVVSPVEATASAVGSPSLVAATTSAPTTATTSVLVAATTSAPETYQR